MDYQKIISEMTLEEKFNYLTGADMNSGYKLERFPVERMRYHDGPFGLRMKEKDNSRQDIMEQKIRSSFPSAVRGVEVPSTAFPTGSSLGATWDEDLVRRVGNALGEEFRAYGINGILGPAMNIKRHPLCGRNFEYFSEDPYLTGKMGAAYVKGVQEKGVGACPKHFAANNQENGRHYVSSEVDERTLREIQGVSCLPVESVPKPKEQILRSRSFSHATNDRSVLLSSVSTHMTEVARQLRREKAEAKKAGVFFLTSPFKENEPWHAAEPVTELTLPTSDTMRLVEVACRLVEAHWRPGFRYCKAGAFVTDLIPEGSCSVTGSLFDLPDEERDATRRRLMECLDDLTRRFGKGAWKIGSSGLADGWQMKRDRLTPAYLTRWADIMTVS